MATTKFNTNIINAARSLKDRRTDPSVAGDTGMRYTSALLSYYQNKAVRAFIAEQLAALGVTAFCEKFSRIGEDERCFNCGKRKGGKAIGCSVGVISCQKRLYAMV